MSAVRALDKKLLRDLMRLKGQVVSIAFVIASGVALLVMSLSAVEALSETAEAYYDRYRFGHVFATVKRAPAHLEERIAELPGVQSVQLRIVKQAIVDVPGFAEPLMGRLVSIPEGDQPVLNRLALRSGRLVAPGRPDEVVVNESFAKAHGLRPGDTISAIIDDTRRELRVVGTAMSPEFIYVISPFALIPDKKRYGILWMGNRALEAAYDYDGAFNDLTLTVLRGTDTRGTVQALDALLAPYGGVGAIDRNDHVSSWFVMNELEQNSATARILPTIFLLVAAFLINMVLSRLIATERAEIGLLKAFGYSNSQVGWHYAKLVIVMVTIGVLLGWGLGFVLGRFSTASYAENLNFAILLYRPGPVSFAIGAVVSLAVALLATARAVRGAADLTPVVAMRPPAPPTFRQRSQVLYDFRQWLDEPTRIIFRQLARWPGKAAVTTLSYSGAIGLMVLSFYFTDAVEVLARTHFGESMRAELTLGFTDPKATPVVSEVERLPGVMTVEPMRVVPADLVAGHRTHRGSLQGVTSEARLTRIFDVDRGPVPVPAGGVALSRVLAEKLSVDVGDEIRVDVLEGQRPSLRLPVADVFGSYIGMLAYVDLDLLNRALGDRPLAGYVNALIDEGSLAQLMPELKGLPSVSAVGLKSVSIANFHETIAGSLTFFVGFFTAFSFAMGFGVTYNTQRIALSERGRELATLRVLGFSRVEVLYILIGETLMLVCLSLPLGSLLGYGLTAAFVNTSGFQTELMRLPLFIEPSTYGAAIVVLLGSTLISGLAMKSRVDRLDLISVLKTRE